MTAEPERYPGWIPLTPEQQQSGKFRRNWAFVAMRLAIIPCFVALVFGGVLWGMTCVRLVTMQLLPLAGVVIGEEETSNVSEETGERSGSLISDERQGWWNGLIGLRNRLIDADISTVSSLIAWVTPALMAWHWLRFFRRRRGRPDDVKQYASRQTVFPPAYQQLCVRLGLLGTFASMTLVALTEGKLNADNIFPLLCASIVSTFVGCLAAYIAIPTVEILNAYALGQHQLPRPQTRQQQLSNEIETAIGNLQGFSFAVAQVTKTLVGDVQLLDQLATLNTSVLNLTKALGDTETKGKEHEEQIKEIVQTTVENTRQLADATAALDATARNVKGISAANAESAKLLMDSREKMDNSSRQLNKLTSMSRRLFAALRKHIGQGVEFLGRWSQQAKRATDVLETMRSEQKSLNDEVSSLKEKTERIQETLTTLERIEERQKAQQQAAADIKNEVVEKLEKVESSLAAHNGAPHFSSVGKKNRRRWLPWW